MKAVLASVQKDDEKAIKYLTLAHELAPQDHLILLNLADIYAENNQKAKALEMYSAVEAIEGLSESIKAQAGELKKRLETVSEVSSE